MCAAAHPAAPAARLSGSLMAKAPVRTPTPPPLNVTTRLGPPLAQPPTGGHPSHMPPQLNQPAPLAPSPSLRSSAAPPRAHQRPAPPAPRAQARAPQPRRSPDHGRGRACAHASAAQTAPNERSTMQSDLTVRPVPRAPGWLCCLATPLPGLSVRRLLRPRAPPCGGPCRRRAPFAGATPHRRVPLVPRSLIFWVISALPYYLGWRPPPRRRPCLPGAFLVARRHCVHARPRGRRLRVRGAHGVAAPPPVKLVQGSQWMQGSPRWRRSGGAAGNGRGGTARRSGAGCGTGAVLPACGERIRDLFRVSDQAVAETRAEPPGTVPGPTARQTASPATRPRSLGCPSWRRS